ncbi:TPA: restriction endonuclease [Pseudomonas aeruginosa]
MATVMVSPIHFEDFSGIQFERLVFAYHLRAGWRDLVWNGQSGGDQGRDITGTELFDDRPARKTIIQCANRDTLTLAKARGDMEKAMKVAGVVPDAFKFVSRGAVSDTSRRRIEQAAAALGVAHVTIWSGVEFEENLRLRAEYLLHRFVRGSEFPDAEADIRRFVDDFPDLSDTDALQLMAAVFDRSAFRTPFHQESSLPAFQQAIEDTIGALNTGVWRTRDGDEIRRIPSVHHLRDMKIRTTLEKVVRHVDDLRRIFVTGLREGEIQSCGCGDPDCPTFVLSPRIADQLDAARRKILTMFRSVYAPFNVDLE